MERNIKSMESRYLIPSLELVENVFTEWRKRISWYCPYLREKLILPRRWRRTRKQTRFFWMGLSVKNRFESLCLFFYHYSIGRRLCSVGRICFHERALAFRVLLFYLYLEPYFYRSHSPCTY